MPKHERMGAKGFHDLRCPDTTYQGAIISREEYLEWKSRMEPIIAKRVNNYCRTEDEALEFLLMDGWRWETRHGKKVLVSPFYSLCGYTSYREAVELKLWYIEYSRFRQNMLEEKTGEQVRNCKFDRG